MPGLTEHCDRPIAAWRSKQPLSLAVVDAPRYNAPHYVSAPCFMQIGSQITLRSLS